MNYPSNILHNNGKITYYEPVADYKVEIRAVKFSPYFYIRTNNDSNIKTIFDDPVEKYTYENHHQRQDIISNNFDSEDIFESDIGMTTRWLIDNFHDKTEQQHLYKLRTWFIDIEVLVDDRFPDIAKADSPITCISFFDNKIDKTITLALVPKGYQPKKLNDCLCFDFEEELLRSFIYLINKSQAQILSGWNSEKFDIPYIVNRCKKILGEEEANKISPVNRIDTMHKGDISIKGITCLDYLQLYKKFEINLRDSYQLNSIAKFELDTEKIQFEGSLDDLYYNDFEKYIEYNRRDVDIVKQLDDKKKYIDLTRNLTMSACREMEDVYYNTRLIDGYVLSALKGMNKVVPDKPEREKKESAYAGAYVSDPVVGMHDWVIALDLSSLYPSIVRSLNMSPETIVDDSYNGDCFTAANGSRYRKDKRGIFPLILDEITKKRKYYKKKVKEEEEKGDEEKAKFYWMRQYTYKILLNSAYGYIGADVTRFFNRDIAEGITLTGQAIVKFSEKHFNNKDIRCIYVDTDSNFLLMPKEYNTTEKCVEFGKKLTKDINSKLDEFAKDKCNIVDDNKHYFEFNFEKICKSILLVSKKRYAYHLIWKEGFDKDSIEVTGIEVVRSDTPEVCRDFTKDVLEMILRKKDKADIDKFVKEFKKKYEKMDLEQQAIPVGVKGVNKYAKNKHPIKGTPVHVRAALYYNLYGVDKGDPVIKSSDKIKWYYSNDSRIPSMAFIETPTKKVREFKVDTKKMLQRLVDGKIEHLYNALGWRMPSDNMEIFSDDIFS